jgi:branched-subunit amino acid aminotransferase/4-amino-4-deoxychorismate lyase
LVRIQITRGASGAGYLPGDGEPTLVIETLPRMPAPQEPVTLWLSQYRRIPAASLPIYSKLCQGMNSTLARMEAQEHGCFDALQLNQEGMICETSSANIFWLRDDILYTPALACGVLEGAMRAAIMELASFPVQETTATLDAMQEAQAVCITNAVWQALAVVALEPASYAWDSAALAQRLNALLNEDICAYSRQHADAWQKP